MSAIPVRQELTDTLFRKFAAYVYQNAGITLGDNKRELVRARVGKLIRQHKMGGYRDYYEYLVADESGEAMEEMLNAISTNLTAFFREPKHFDYLRKHLLPQLIRERQSDRTCRIRAWSAGCSTGEEPYSLAITLLEALPPGANWDVKLLATDLDTSVLRTGERGVYPTDRIKAVPMAQLRRYFQRGEGTTKGMVRTREELRRLIRFRRLNLMHPWPFRSRMDFIFCRNVMIYFDRPTQQNLVNRFHDLLAPGGHLFIGHSEGLTGISHRFAYVQPTVYKRVG